MLDKRVPSVGTHVTYQSADYYSDLIWDISKHYITCIGPTQLLNATFKDMDIDDRQILKYQPSVTSRVMFHHLIPLIMIKY